MPKPRTVPLPVPPLVTVRRWDVAANVAVTALAASMLTTQFETPLHAPVQPAKAEPEAGVATSVTRVPIG